MNYYQFENKRVKLTDKNKTVYIGDVLTVQPPEDNEYNRICVGLEVKDKYGNYSIIGFFEDEIESIELID